MKKIILHKGWMALAICSLILLGVFIVYFESVYEDALKKTNQEIIESNKEAMAKIKEIQLENDKAKAEETRLVSGGFGNVNMFQGVQVQIEGINILNKFFRQDEDYGVTKLYGGEVFHDTDNFVLDPDRPNRGYPNLRVQVLQPQPFTHKSFFSRLFDSNYSGPEFLENTFGNSSKVDSFY